MKIQGVTEKSAFILTGNTRSTHLLQLFYFFFRKEIPNGFKNKEVTKNKRK
jgi:hypothetical protein